MACLGGRGKGLQFFLGMSTVIVARLYKSPLRDLTELSDIQCLFESNERGGWKFSVLKSLYASVIYVILYLN